jgi:hypothetical protein
MKPVSRLHRIVVLISLCLLAQFAISWKAWLPINRDFPLIAAFSFLPLRYGVFIDGLLFGLMLICVAALMPKPFSKLIIGIVISVFVLLVLEDITRFQPWLYMYGLMLLSVAFSKNEQQTLSLIRIILVGTYFWSGMQKFNHAFTVEIFPWLMNPLGLQGFFEQHHRLAYAIPFVEILGAIGLLFKQFQKYAGLLLIMMHLVLLYTLGPLGNSWNKLIWPWNASLIGIIALLVNDRNYADLSEIKPLFKSKWFIALFTLTCIMPMFNYFGCWDNDLSGSLYAGNIPRANFYYSNIDEENMPVSAHHSFYTAKNMESLSIDQWALDELNTPVYPEERYFKRIAAYLSSKVRNQSSAGLMITEKEKFTSHLNVLSFPCDGLK